MTADFSSSPTASSPLKAPAATNAEAPLCLSRAEVREFDRLAIEEFGIPGPILMENAGKAVAQWLYQLNPHKRPVLLACGKGNNAGDGFVMARHLTLSGIDAVVLLFVRPEELSGDAAFHFQRLAPCRVPVRILTGPALEAELQRPEFLFGAGNFLVDCLFGTGLIGPPRPPFDRIIEAINAADATVLAVDIPSGLDCDTGQPLGPTVRANYTATFVALKPGFLQPSAQEYLGQVAVFDIGTPRQLLERFEKLHRPH